MPLRLFPLLLTATLTFTSCVSLKRFDPSLPIQVEKSGFFTVYKQDHQTLDPHSLVDGLSDHPSSRDKASGLKFLHYSSLGLAVVGGYMIGYNAVAPLKETPSQEKNRKDNFNIGLGVTVIAIGLSAYNGARLSSAVEAYNAGHSPKSTLTPLLDWNSDTQTTTIGFQKTF